MDWDQYFINLTDSISTRSKDPNTKVGSVLVDENNHIVGTGYNGFPPGFPDESEYWQRSTKYDYVIHAELNAIIHSSTTKNCTLYTNLSPCSNCAKHIAAAGIKRVCYKQYKKDEVTEFIFAACGIIMEPLKTS